MPNILLCRNLGVAYVPIPKVACRSIKTAIAPAFGVPYISDIHNANWDSVPNLQSLAALTGVFRFTVVRNPWDRLVSCYFHKFLEVRESGGKDWIFGHLGDRLRLDMTFDEFIEAISTIPDEWANEHFVSQWSRISYEGNLAVDQVIRFEQLQDEWRLLQDRFGFDDLPHANRTDHPHYRTLYSERNALIVAERYGTDIRELGYSF